MKTLQSCALFSYDNMDVSQKIYVFSKQRQIVEQKVVCFVKKMTEVQELVKEAGLLFLIEKCKRLLAQLHSWEGRILASLAGGKMTLEQVTQECVVLSKIDKLYNDYSSEYNEILQTLLCEKYTNKM